MSTSVSEITVASLAALPQAAAQLLTQLGERRVLLLNGDLGAGKTTLVQELCRQLGVTEAVSSPTFALVNEYVRTTDAGTTESVYHLDLYRLKDVDEALDMGLEEYLYSGHYCFVEWPDVAAGLYPEDALRVRLEAPDDTTRKILLL